VVHVELMVAVLTRCAVRHYFVGPLVSFSWSFTRCYCK